MLHWYMQITAEEISVHLEQPVQPTTQSYMLISADADKTTCSVLPVYGLNLADNSLKQAR